MGEIPLMRGLGSFLSGGFSELRSFLLLFLPPPSIVLVDVEGFDSTADRGSLPSQMGNILPRNAPPR